MTKALTSDDRAAIERVIAGLETAWNAGDGAGFAEPFADDADFVNVRADHHQGRPAIAAGHDGIFRSIYAGSRNRYRVRNIRLLHDDVALAHVDAELDVPAGPLSGQHRALFSAVLMRDDSSWKIASFHNTMQPPAQRG